MALLLRPGMDRGNHRSPGPAFEKVSGGALNPV